jgi:hypothetical protein
MKMVGFTKRRRVTTWARGGVLGKTAKRKIQNGS